MTKTATAPTGTHIGQCKVCKAKYYAATEAERGYCGCRAAEGYPATFVKWGAVKARVSERECGVQCTHAKSLICVCACGGVNHGAELGPLG